MRDPLVDHLCVRPAALAHERRPFWGCWVACCPMEGRQQPARGGACARAPQSNGRFVQESLDKMTILGAKWPEIATEGGGTVGRICKIWTKIGRFEAVQRTGWDRGRK